MRTKGVLRLLTLVVALMLVFSLAVPVFAAGNITTVTYWDGIASQIAKKAGGIKDADDLALQLSRVAGKNEFNDNGTKYPTFVISASQSGPFYVGGIQLSASNPPDLTRYTDLQLSNLTNNQGQAVTGVTVWYYTTATDDALNRVTAHVTTNLLDQANVTPDTGTAMTLLSGVMPMVNTLLGLIVVAISIGMTVFSALDIVYLAFPAFRTKINDSIEARGPGTKTNKDGSVTSRWVTKDAIFAIEEAEKAQIAPWGSYFKRRVLAYIFLAIILFILLTGNIFAITTLVTNALQGLFSSLGIG